MAGSQKREEESEKSELLFERVIGSKMYFCCILQTSIFEHPTFFPIFVLMLSKKSQYAFKALSYLVEKRNEGPVLISEIAEHKKIPLKFLENIFAAAEKI